MTTSTSRASAMLDPLDGVEGTARAADGLMLRTLRWQPRGAPWAAMLLVHGLGEHAGRYRHVGRALADAGIDVHAYDHRGFGGSAGSRAYVDRFAQYHDDLGERLAAVHALLPGLPLVLFGHSFGGLVAAGYVLEEPARRLRPDLLVLSAPGLDSTIARWKFALARPLSTVVPRLRVANGIAPGSLSRDPSIDAANAVDLLCQTSSSTRLATESDREQGRVRDMLRDPAGLPVPTLVIHGSEDPVVPVTATECFEGRPNVTRLVYAGLRHEPHNEPEAPQVIADVIAWLRAAAAGRLAGEGAVAAGM